MSPNMVDAQLPEELREKVSLLQKVIQLPRNIYPCDFQHLQLPPKQEQLPFGASLDLQQHSMQEERLTSLATMITSGSCFAQI